MIRKINLNDSYYYNELGLLINNDFTKLFNLEDVLKYDYNKIYVYEENGLILGFIHIKQSFEEADIINICVNKEHRRKKIGTKLINYVIKTDDIKELNIEVRKSNPAVLFYINNDFKIIREIPNYYGDEDAYFMKKTIS